MRRYLGVTRAACSRPWLWMATVLVQEHPVGVWKPRLAVRCGRPRPWQQRVRRSPGDLGRTRDPLAGASRRSLTAPLVLVWLDEMSRAAGRRLIAGDSVCPGSSSAADAGKSRPDDSYFVKPGVRAMAAAPPPARGFACRWQAASQRFEWEVAPIPM